jgi:hypothetical protein
MSQPSFFKETFIFFHLYFCFLVRRPFGRGAASRPFAPFTYFLTSINGREYNFFVVRGTDKVYKGERARLMGSKFRPSGSDQ